MIANPPDRRTAVSIVRRLGLVFPIVAMMTSAGAGEAIRVRSVEPGLELRLDDGRLVRLAGFDPAAPTPGAPDLEDRSAVILAAMIVGKPATIETLAGTPDRWGRLVARISIGGDGVAPAAPCEDLAFSAITAGLGRYRAEPSAHPCRDVLLAGEATARTAKLGLWADPYYAVLAVDDRPAFGERAGTIVVAQGRLTTVLPGPYRTRLRFATGERFRTGRTSFASFDSTLSATVQPHTMKTFEAQRVTFSSLIGRTLRWRGLLDTRFGPTIELAGPDALEVLPDAPGVVAPTRPN